MQTQPPDQPGSMVPFLTPITRPTRGAMRIVYFFVRRQFGKVVTPLSVFAVRMPLRFAAVYARISKLDKKLVLPARTAHLIREQVASINQCHFCMDIGRLYATAEHPEEAARLDALGQYASSELFAPAERAALDFATELTRDRAVRKETFDALTGYFSEREICDIVWLVASEHLYNLTNIGLNVGSDGLCALRPR